MSTITTINSSDNISDSRAVINTNLSNLNTDKAEKSGQVFTGQISFSGTTHVGVKLNSLNSTQRDALTPANGMIIYNSTTNQVEKYANGSWVGEASVSDGSTTAKGIFEEATEAEIDADTAAGATSARLAVNPSTLATSKYGTRLPSAGEKSLLSAITASAAEINITDGLTATTAQLNEAGTFFANTDITGAEAETLSSGATSNADTLHTHSFVKKQSSSTTSVVISADATETTLITTSIAANTLGTNNLIEGRIKCTTVSIGNGANLVIRLKYGSTTVASATFTNGSGATRAPDAGYIVFTLLASGATNTQAGEISGSFVAPGVDATSEARAIAFGEGTAAEDSTGALNLVITAQFSSNAAANTLTATKSYVKIVK